MPGDTASMPVGWAPDADDDHYDDDFTEWLNATGKAGTDGTGGIDSDPRTRRVYAGAAVLDPTGKKVAYMYCKVPGGRQYRGPNSPHSSEHSDVYGRPASGRSTLMRNMSSMEPAPKTDPTTYWAGTVTSGKKFLTK